MKKLPNKKTYWTFQLYIGKELYDLVTAEAEAERMSKSMVIRRALLRHYGK